MPRKDRAAVWQEIRRRNDNIHGDWMLEQALEYEGFPDPAADRTQRKDLKFMGADGDISGGISYPERPEARFEGSAGAEAPNGGPEKPVRPRMPRPAAAAGSITREMAQAGVWLWPQGDISRDGRFMAVTPSGVAPRLTVNGQPVDDDKIGERIENSSVQAQVVAWYGVRLTPGENRLAISGLDPFGNQRVLARKIFQHPGPAEKLHLVPAADRLAADGGRSMLEIRVRLEDARGLPAGGVHFVSLEAEDGTWLEPDLQEKEPAHQIRLADGEARVHLRSSDKTGRVAVRASMGQGFQDEISLAFVSPLRPLLAAGLVALSARFNEMQHPDFAPPAQADRFDDSVFVDGRGALFLKGKIKGDALLTIAYDTRKDDDEALFRDIDPDAYYPVYGDASVKGYEAQARSKLYVKLEKDRHSAMWGDFETDALRTDSIARYQRTLTGGNLRYETGGTVVQAFGARPDFQRSTEVLRGNGTATFYRIGGAPIEQNSEILEVITRQRENPGIVMATRRLSRFADYTMDPVSGYITLHEAVPSQDQDGNPVYLRVTYDSLDDGQAYSVGGVRMEQKLHPDWTVGGSYTFDDHPDDGLRMGSGFVQYKADERHKAIVEAARLDHPDGSGGGKALRAEWESRWSPKLDTRFNGYGPTKGLTIPVHP